MLKKIAEFIITLFYCGKIPKAPGTLGTTFALLVLLPFFVNLTPFFVFVAFVVVTLLGFVLTPLYLQGSIEDKQEIVIDEASGMYLTVFIALCGAKYVGVSQKWIILLACFVLFRFFDMLKPSLVGLVDAKLKGTLGIMLDDILAGIYAGFTFLIAAFVYKYI